MNRYVFAAKNVCDKLGKMLRGSGTLGFYLKTYVLSRFERIEPNVYIVSYPKCGRTWIRIILQKYLYFLGIAEHSFTDRAILSLHADLNLKFDHDQGNWVPAPPSIDQLSFNVVKYANKKVVFLARDPRDVLVSSWYHLHFRERIYSGTLSQFVRDDLLGIHKIVAFMNMWMNNRDLLKDFLLLTYEEMHNDPVSHIHNLIKFLEIPVEEEAVKRAVEESSFDKMKQMEKRGSLQEPWMKPGSNDSENAMKVRRGRIGSFRDELSHADIAMIDKVIQSSLTPELPYRT